MEEITIDLKDLFQVVMANKKKIAAITAAFMIAGGAYLLVAPPVYQSTSLLRIKQDKGLGDSILSKVSGGNAMDDKQRMMTDAEILKSRNVVLVPIRTGLGARLGVNVGYLKLTPTPTWNPF